MVKSIGILLGGIFIGAVGAEIVSKKCPDVIGSIYANASKITAGATEAFKKGYASVMQSQPDAKPSV